MSDKPHNNDISEEPRFIRDAGESWIDDDGKLASSVGKVEVTEDLLEAILAKDLPAINDPVGSYRTDEKLTKALLAKDKIRDIGFNPTDHGIGSAGENERGQKQDDRPFVGAVLDYKVKPRHTSDEGKDPLGIRNYIGDEFPRMLAYGPPVLEQKIVTDENGNRKMETKVVEEAKPAFYSYWPEGTPLEEMKTIKVNIATKVPDYMKRGTLAASMDARKDFSFNGQSLEEAFTPITDKVEGAWRKYAKEFEETFGIRLDVRRDDSDNPHPDDEVNISVCGFSGGNERLAGFANFPEAVNRWPGLDSLGHKQGFMMLNHEYTNHPNIDEDAVYDLILHEMGHFFGWVHPHDLGAMEMTQAEALNSTAMAYTDGKFGKFKDQKGVTSGVVDLFFRNYMANPPAINDEHGTVYDMEKQYKHSLGENADSKVMGMSGMIPSIPILNNGEATVLKGSTNDDIIDTEPGHVSFRKNHIGVKQGYALVEGHISKVIGRAGNNHIFTSSKGSQEIHPGPGNNKIHVYAPQIGNNKVIHSTGNDTLVLHQDILLAHGKMNGKGISFNLEVEQDGNDIILKGEGGSIVLKDQLVKDKGISSIAVINDEGRSVMQQDVRRFTINGFTKDVLEPMKRHTRRILEAQKEEAQAKANGGHDHKANSLPEGVLPDIREDHCGHDHSKVGNDNHSRDNARGGDSAVDSHLARLRKRAEERAAEGERQR